jgi:TonB family protein
MLRLVNVNKRVFKAALCVFLLQTGALAQATQVPATAAPPAPAAPVTRLVPPAIKKDDGAIYPKAAIERKVRVPVTVVVVLDIDAAGAVAKAAVEAPNSGGEGNGFDESALEAAAKLVFTPATRNDVAIASRIKYRFEFPVQTGKLAGRIAKAGTSDTSIAGAEVSARGPDGQTKTTTTDAAGAWELPGLPFGAYVISVSALNYEASTSAEEVDPGAETRLTLRLKETAAVPSVQDQKTKAAEAKAAASDIEEVSVRGNRPPREVTKRSLDQRELSRSAGTNGDALRALQNLPGIARPPGIAGLLIVRGSAPQETNIFVDGTLVPLVYHFGGLSSVIPTEMLEKIDFYPGNFSAQYGRVTGGIVDVGLRAPKKDKLHGLVQADFIDVRALAEGPLGKGWSFALAARRSWFGAWLGPALKATGSNVTTTPTYYDYQAIVQKDFSARESVRFSFFGADDRLEILVARPNGSNPTLSGTVGLGTAFYRLQARYKNRISDDTEVRIVAAAGKDAIQFNLGDNYFKIDIKPITLRAELAQKIARGVTMNIGMDWLWQPYDLSIRFPPIPKPGEPPPGPFGSQLPLTVNQSDALYRPSLYNELEMTPWKGGRIVSGVRADYAKDTKKWDLSPRALARQDLTTGFPRTTLKAGVGVFRQPPQPQETNSTFGQPGLSSNRAIHYTLGGEQEITKELEVGIEGYYRDLDNLVVQGRGNSGQGTAYGLETLIRYKPTGKFFGFLAYTLSRSVRQDTKDSPERLFQYDQTHIMTAVASYQLGRGWELGGRFRLVSGSNVTPRQYGFLDESAGAYTPISYPPFGQRLPMFHQLDIRVDKAWQFKAWKLSAYLDLVNAYNKSNVEGISYNYNSTLSSAGQSIPFLPSLGLRGEL